MRVAVPWSLSHYIPLNGFHPLYRALFDYAPADVDLTAWDNVKLYQHFAQNTQDRNLVIRHAVANKQANKAIPSSVERTYADYFYAPDRVLTESLQGEIELHHTAPFPSLRRPFVFHCESFDPVFFPLAQQGQGDFDKLDELRNYYRKLFKNPLCQGIYSHIPETLDNFSVFFLDAEIDNKLFGSKIGLSNLSIDPDLYRQKSLVKPRFLFTDSAHQQCVNFFKQGGHIALRFWKEFRSAGRDGTLILRCSKPDDSSLANHGVDLAFVHSELGRSIVWVEGYLANHEINALMASANFFLLPSASLHSASILLAMMLGTVPIVTDTLGTSVYVTDRDSAIVLNGVKQEIWHRDQDTGLLVDRYQRMPAIASSLVDQMMGRVCELLDSEDAYLALSRRAAERAQTNFSGETFASDFWETVKERAARSQQTTSAPSNFLQNCTIDRTTWSRLFESSPQPMLLLNTGMSTVYELGGAAVHIVGSQKMNQTDWSVMTTFVDPSAPVTTFANDLAALGDLFLTNRHGETSERFMKLKRRLSNMLMSFPRIHNLASRNYQRAVRAKKFLDLWLRYVDYKRGRIGDASYTALVMEDVHGFNIIQSFHKYFAIPQSEGVFTVLKAERKQYSRTYCAFSLERAVAKVNRRAMGRVHMIATLPLVGILVNWIGGEDRVRAALNFLGRDREIQE